MFITLILTGAVLLAVAWKLLGSRVERCPECGRIRESGYPICDCGWVFEYPDDDHPLEYGDPDDPDFQDSPD